MVGLIYFFIYSFVQSWHCEHIKSRPPCHIKKKKRKQRCGKIAGLSHTPNESAFLSGVTSCHVIHMNMVNISCSAHRLYIEIMLNILLISFLTSRKWIKNSLKGSLQTADCCVWSVANTTYWLWWVFFAAIYTVGGLHLVAYSLWKEGRWHRCEWLIGTKCVIYRPCTFLLMSAEQRLFECGPGHIHAETTERMWPHVYFDALVILYWHSELNSW